MCVLVSFRSLIVIFSSTCSKEAGLVRKGDKKNKQIFLFFFFFFFALRGTEVEKSGKKNLWRIQNRRIPWTGYPRSLFNRLLIVIRRASHRSAFVHIGQAWR